VATAAKQGVVTGAEAAVITFAGMSGTVCYRGWGIEILS
jgi:hypothetical protein